MLIQRWYKGKAASGLLKGLRAQDNHLHVKARRARIADLVAHYFPGAAERGLKRYEMLHFSICLFLFPAHSIDTPVRFNAGQRLNS